jgi:hypothetical protein
MPLPDQDLRHYTEISARLLTSVEHDVTFALRELWFVHRPIRSCYVLDWHVSDLTYGGNPVDLVMDTNRRDSLAYEIARGFVLKKYDFPRHIADTLEIRVNDSNIKFGGKMAPNCFSIDLTARAIFAESNISSDDSKSSAAPGNHGEAARTT